MTVPAFVTRDLTWRSYQDAEPEHGDYCCVRMAGIQVTAHYQCGAYGTWVLAGGRKFRAVPSDTWRPEDDR